MASEKKSSLGFSIPSDLMRKMDLAIAAEKAKQGAGAFSKTRLCIEALEEWLAAHGYSEVGITRGVREDK